MHYIVFQNQVSQHIVNSVFLQVRLWINWRYFIQEIRKVKKQKFRIKIYENLLDGSEHFALVKGTIKRGVVPRVRVISSNVVQNYLINQKLPNSFNKTLNYFRKYNNCVLVFIKDSNLKSVTQTLKDYKNKKIKQNENNKQIRNYGIGAQIIKDLKIKKMILITKTPKKIIGLEGFDIKITKKELIWWKRKFWLYVQITMKIYL